MHETKSDRISKKSINMSTLKNTLGRLKRNIKFLLKHHDDSSYLRWYFNHSHRLINFKEKHRGEDCFIIGNGPSLNKMNLSVLNSFYTFGLNKIYLIFEKHPLNLSYYVTVNQLVIEQSSQEIQNLQCPCFIEHEKSQDVIGQRNNIFRLATTGRPYMFQTDITQKICEGNTVTYVALQLAYYMGFKRVFLIGVDHNFKYSGKPNEKQVLGVEDPNHFDPRYFGNQEWNLPDLEASELAFHLANFHFKRSDRTVFDATVDGKLQIFEKISFDKALSMAKPKHTA